ncbi:hypothetical protein GGQ71_001921 [Rhizobium taibaishanense]|uniref:Uncharacterized protein n=1 Tax=Allorhizobium taibaishanense TaxID=887144 RepID=A0A7W6HM24_9HYPH|nr:hypothetical protein [Allorhizobium taibaishanense]
MATGQLRDARAIDKLKACVLTVTDVSVQSGLTIFTIHDFGNA